MKEKYSAIITYDNGAMTGATVKAEGREEAWKKLLAVLKGGERVCQITLSQIILTEREVK